MCPYRKSYHRLVKPALFTHCSCGSSSIGLFFKQKYKMQQYWRFSAVGVFRDIHKNRRLSALIIQRVLIITISKSLLTQVPLHKNLSHVIYLTSHLALHTAQLRSTTQTMGVGCAGQVFQVSVLVYYIVSLCSQELETDSWSCSWEAPKNLSRSPPLLTAKSGLLRRRTEISRPGQSVSSADTRSLFWQHPGNPSRQTGQDDLFEKWLEILQ